MRLHQNVIKSLITQKTRREIELLLPKCLKNIEIFPQRCSTLEVLSAKIRSPNCIVTSMISYRIKWLIGRKACSNIVHLLRKQTDLPEYQGVKAVIFSVILLESATVDLRGDNSSDFTEKHNPNKSKKIVFGTRTCNVCFSKSTLIIVDLVFRRDRGYFSDFCFQLYCIQPKCMQLTYSL